MMYLISTRLSADPRSPDGQKRYQNLKNAVTALGAWSERLEPTWLVESRHSASRIRDLLKPHLQDGDRLFVAQISQNWASASMGPDFPAWIRRRDFSGPGPARESKAAPAESAE